MADQKPLIIHVVRQFLPNRGGMEDVILNLCQHSLERGYRVRVVTLDRLFVAPETVLPQQETLSGIEIVRIAWRGSSRYPLAFSVFRHLREADIVHVHAIDFFFDALAWGWLLHRKPMVATTHGGFFHTRKFARLKTIWFNTISRISAASYSAIACCSQADKRMFDRIAPSRTELVENGADTKKFAEASATTPQKSMVTIGRFSANKQIIRLLDTTKLLTERDPQWKLTIIGVPSDLSEADIRSAIADRNLEANVHLAIGATNGEIADIMHDTSLFVSASDYEGFGLVAVEAMSAGLVPVLHPNDAYSDLAKKHKCVRLVGFENAMLSANAIEQSFMDLSASFPDLRNNAIAEAQDYAWPTVSRKYAAIYDQIMRGVRKSKAGNP
jgi:alpha-1,3-mannosyltransferase